MNPNLSGRQPVQQNDEMLLAQLRLGDITAFNSLFRRYSRRTTEFAATLVKDLFLAEELVSDVFLSLWARREELPEIAVFRAYLFTAVRYQAKRAYARHLASAIVPLQDYTEGTQDPSADPAERLEGIELSDRLLALVERLPPGRRLIFKLKKIDDLSYRAIAQLLQISEKTVENQLSDAIKSLRKHLQFSHLIVLYWIQLLLSR
jgi:RNA polymerase sigma-70 factor (ECF subfamily)